MGEPRHRARTAGEPAGTRVRPVTEGGATAGGTGPGRPGSPAAAWDVATYTRFSDERSRPFVDLLARVRTPSAATVVDLGCGEGTMTAVLADRWPGARVTGVDSSAEMLAAT